MNKIKSEIWFDRLGAMFESGINDLGYPSQEVEDMLTSKFDAICVELHDKVGDIGNIVYLESDLKSRQLKVVYTHGILLFDVKVDDVESILEAVRKDGIKNFDEDDFYSIIMLSFKSIGDLFSEQILGIDEVDGFYEKVFNYKDLTVQECIKQLGLDKKVITDQPIVGDVVLDVVSKKFKYVVVRATVIGTEQVISNVSDLKSIIDDCLELLKSDYEMKYYKVDVNRLECSNVGINTCNELTFTFKEVK